MALNPLEKSRLMEVTQRVADIGNPASECVTLGSKR